MIAASNNISNGDWNLESPLWFVINRPGKGEGSFDLPRLRPVWKKNNILLTGTTLGSVTDTYTYNSFGEVSNYTAAYPAGLSCQIGYTRDAVGRITGKTEAINGITTTWGYTYDLAGRLTQTTKNGDLWASYGYDTNGNRLTKTTTSQTISGTYDAQDRLTAYGNYTFTYTANGELETKTDTATSETTTYSYDVLGNLKSVVLPDSTLIEYVVDGRNRRVGKKVNGTLERQWLYDGQLRPVAELDGTGALISQFVYATHINVPDYMIKGGVTYRIITDHLGSLRFVIDTATGTIAQRIDYDDWGNVLVNTAPDFTPFGFAGGMYDSQTKLVRFGARDYDAEVGRWTSKDPLGMGEPIISEIKRDVPCLFGNNSISNFPSSPIETLNLTSCSSSCNKCEYSNTTLNLYEYAKNNPVNRNDPSGMSTVIFCVRVYFTDSIVCMKTSSDECEPFFEYLGEYTLGDFPFIFSGFLSEDQFNNLKQMQLSSDYDGWVI